MNPGRTNSLLLLLLRRRRRRLLRLLRLLLRPLGRHASTLEERTQHRKESKNARKPT